MVVASDPSVERVFIGTLTSGQEYGLTLTGPPAPRRIYIFDCINVEGGRHQLALLSRPSATSAYEIHNVMMHDPRFLPWRKRCRAMKEQESVGNELALRINAATSVVAPSDKQN